MQVDSAPVHDSYRIDNDNHHSLNQPISAPVSSPHYRNHHNSHYRTASGNSINIVRGNTPVQSNLRVQNSPLYSQNYQRQSSPMSGHDDYEYSGYGQYNPYVNQNQNNGNGNGNGYNTNTAYNNSAYNNTASNTSTNNTAYNTAYNNPNNTTYNTNSSNNPSNPSPSTPNPYSSHLTPSHSLPLPRPHSARPMSSNSSLSSSYRNSDIDPLPLPNYGNGHSRNPSSSGSVSEHASQSASASMFDLSQSYISTQFGPKSSALMPRIQTIEMYRKNAKKSNDPVIQFQFAQYMLQTALLSAPGQANGASNRQSLFSSDLTSSASSTTTASSSEGGTGSGSGSSGVGVGVGAGVGITATKSIDEKKIKHDLLKEAISILRKLSDRGYADAQYLLADALASGALGKPDLRESFSLFQLAAKHGHGEAAYRAALCLERGWGTSKDVRRAAQFLRMAASRNQPGAMLRLGMACFYGRMGMSNTPQVKQEGIKWLKLAANEATEVFPQAPYELAKIVEVGYSDIVIPDQHWAVQLYVKSAELNYIPAARVLGKAYELANLGCPRDAALSIHYYTLGAIKGDPESMYSMCAWYMMGAEPILQKNEEEAYEWALRAANLGHPKAQFAVGYFLEHGTGVERDILQSSFWYHKAAEAGNEHAINRLAKEKSQQTKNKKSSKDGPNSSKDKECIIS